MLTLGNRNHLTQITINAASADDVDVARASIEALKRNPKNAFGGQKIYVQISGYIFNYLCDST